MAITFVNSQGTTFNATSANIDTSALSLGDICFVYIAKQSTNVAVTPPAGWTVLIDNGTKLHNTFAKVMAVGGDITATNTFSFPNGRGAIFGLAFRGANTNILSQYQGSIQAATHVSLVDWPSLSSIPGGSLFIGFDDTFDSSGNFFGTTSALPSGYTDSGVGDLGYGSGTPHDCRLFYKINVSGTVDPPDTAPSGGFASNDFGYTAGSFDFPPIYLGAATISDAVGGLSAGATTTAQGFASMPGLGDLLAVPTIPNPCGGSMGYAGGWYGGTGVYGGYGYCPSGAVTPLEPSAISSNVRNIDDSAARLGCGEPTFFITARCAKVVTCVLTEQVTNATWGRKLDDVSTAEITVDLGGDPFSTCCTCLAETEPWCHELHIWRDGEEVWVGPIQELEYSFNQVIIRASDSLAWLGVRIPLVHVNNLGVATDLTTTATGIIHNVFQNTLNPGVDDPNTCEIDNLYTKPTGVLLALFYEAYHQTYLEILRAIGGLGLNFTTLGRTIVLIGDTLSLTPLILLNDEHIIGNLQVTKDGTLLGNRYFVHFDGDSGIPVSGEATNFYCYTVVERLIDGTGLQSGGPAGTLADSYAAASSIAPRTIKIPPGSRLSPDTPWTINQMVPGARVDVAVTRLCLELTQSFILTEVEVTYSPEAGESIGVTLAPLISQPTA